MKNALVALNKKNKNKISVNGCPRRSDFLIKKRYSKKIKDVLFLSFDNKMGIPRIKKNKDINQMWFKSRRGGSRPSFCLLHI